MLNRAAAFFSGGQELPQLLQGEFNQGFVLGVGLAVLMILAMLVLKIVLWMTFRSRRCREIDLTAEGGKVSISHRAIDAAVQAELADLAGISIETIRMFRRGKSCKMQIRCGFSAASGKKFPEISREIRERVQNMLQETFGIDCIHKIDLRLETLSDAGTSAQAEKPAPDSAGFTGNGHLPMM